MRPPRKISDLVGRPPVGFGPGAAGESRALVPTQAPGAAASPNPSGDARASLDADLRETIDLMGKVMADLSDRVDGQGQVALDHRTMTASLFGRFNDALIPALDRLANRVTDVAKQERDARTRIEELLELARHARLQAREGTRWLRLGAAGAGLLAVLLAFLVGLALPRFVAASSTGCWLVGGTWNRSDTGAIACVFWAP